MGLSAKAEEDLGRWLVEHGRAAEGGGRTFGYRVSDGVVDVAYLPGRVAAGATTDSVEALVVAPHSARDLHVY